jgi:hypothetical protein
MNNKERQIISDIYSQLATVVSSTYEKFADKILVQTELGTVVFNKYLIKDNSTGVDLVFRSGDQIAFSSSKTALAYCILDYNNRIMASKRLAELDKLLSSVEIDIDIHKKLKSRGTIDQHVIYHCKLQHDLMRKQQIREEIDKYLITAQRCHKTRNTI